MCSIFYSSNASFGYETVYYQYFLMVPCRGFVYQQGFWIFECLINCTQFMYSFHDDEIKSMFVLDFEYLKYRLIMKLFGIYKANLLIFQIFLAMWWKL